MLTIFVFVLVGLLPVLAAFGVLLWGAVFRRDSQAASLTKGVALGLVAGAIGGLLVGLTLLGLVLALVRFRSH